MVRDPNDAAPTLSGVQVPLPKGRSVRVRTIAALLLMASSTFGILACGDNDIKASKFQSELMKSADLTKAQASCMTDKTYEMFTQKEINKLYTAEKDDDLPKKVRDEFEALTSECAAGS